MTASSPTSRYALGSTHAEHERLIRQVFAHHSSEYIQFDDPETVINAIREVYDQSKRPVGARGNRKRMPTQSLGRS